MNTTTAPVQLDLFPYKFCDYHEKNPQIWEAFKRITLETIRKGFKHYSAKGIFELIRWHTSIGGTGDYKLQNNYTPYYARKFEDEFPQYKGFFRKRESKFDR